MTQHKPSLLLVRGHPGSGKSTFAQAHTAQTLNCVHVENDQFLTQDDIYTFSLENHVKAKQKALDAATQALAEGKNVVVSNTFTTLAEMAPYLALTDNVAVVEMFHDFPNVHAVPEAVVAAKKAAFEPFEGAQQIWPEPPRSRAPKP